MNKNETFEFGAIDQERVKGLIFDVDGTLSDTDDQMIDSMTRFLQPASFLFKNKDPHQFARWFVTAIETPVNFIYSLADRLSVDGLSLIHI